MDLIPIAKDKMINADLIEAIEMRGSKEKRIIVITVGGKQYIPEIEQKELLTHLIKSGASKITNQYFSV